MAYGVDTVNALSSITWSAFKNWSGWYPSFAGRYFGGGKNWTTGEFTKAKSDTNSQLTKIVPIQACVVSRQQTSGTTGYNYGVDDANTTIGNIINAISAKQLSLSQYNSVYVYLDVESGTQLTSDYWAGWSTTVNDYSYNGYLPFDASIYGTIYYNGTKYYPASAIQTAIDDAATAYPKKNVGCYGYWTSHPEYCSNCTGSPSLDWSIFGTFTQTDYSNISLMAWQYAEEDNGCTNCSLSKGFAGGQNLDLDSSASSSLLTYSLDIA